MSHGSRLEPKLRVCALDYYEVGLHSNARSQSLRIRTGAMLTDKGRIHSVIVTYAIRIDTTVVILKKGGTYPTVLLWKHLCTSEVAVPVAGGCKENRLSSHPKQSFMMFHGYCASARGTRPVTI